MRPLLTVVPGTWYVKVLFIPGEQLRAAHRAPSFGSTAVLMFTVGDVMFRA
jgi:hypothetical protein